MEKKYFIAFEGLDGCGKDTQLQKLLEIVKEDNNKPFGNKYSNIWVTREPTKITESGIQISNLIRNKNVSGIKASKLFIEDRKEHSKFIKEILKHSHVFTSRYDLSTFSYQIEQGMDFETLYNLHEYGIKNGAIIPDLTIIFELPVEIAFKRMNLRNSKEECFETLEFQTKLKQNFDSILEKIKKKDNRKIIRINSNQNIDEVTKEMIEKISKILN